MKNQDKTDSNTTKKTKNKSLEDKLEEAEEQSEEYKEQALMLHQSGAREEAHDVLRERLGIMDRIKNIKKRIQKKNKD